MIQALIAYKAKFFLEFFNCIALTPVQPTSGTSAFANESICRSSTSKSGSMQETAKALKLLLKSSNVLHVNQPELQSTGFKLDVDTISRSKTN